LVYYIISNDDDYKDDDNEDVFDDINENDRYHDNTYKHA